MQYPWFSVCHPSVHLLDDGGKDRSTRYSSSTTGVLGGEETRDPVSNKGSDMSVSVMALAHSHIHINTCIRNTHTERDTQSSNAFRTLEDQ